MKPERVYTRGVAQIRETGSIVVSAPRERVFAHLRARMAGEPGLHEGADRLDGRARSFVLRDAPGGTRIIHARSRESAFVPSWRGRDELRAAVAAELFDLQRAVESFDAPRP